MDKNTLLIIKGIAESSKEKEHNQMEYWDSRVSNAQTKKEKEDYQNKSDCHLSAWAAYDDITTKINTLVEALEQKERLEKHE